MLTQKTLALSQWHRQPRLMPRRHPQCHPGGLGFEPPAVLACPQVHHWQPLVGLLAHLKPVAAAASGPLQTERFDILFSLLGAACYSVMH